MNSCPYNLFLKFNPERLPQLAQSQKVHPMDRNEAYPNLFSPFALAGKTLKNRIVHASISPHFGAENGIKDGQIHYYANRAKGGAAMVVTEPLVIAPHQGHHRVIAVLVDGCASLMLALCKHWSIMAACEPSISAMSRTR